MNSTLALAKVDFESELGYFMGVGYGALRGDPAWSTRDTQQIEMDVASGLRRWYFCGHPWSFLRQTATLTLAAGATTIPIPEGFAGLDNGTEIIVLDASGNRISRLFCGNVNKVQGGLGLGVTTGMPGMICLRPIKNVETGKLQRTEFYVWPAADQAYTFTFPYFFTPDYLLDPKQPYALGGVEHHEAILEQCLAVAEARRDNTMSVHAMEAKRLLEISIQIDQRQQPIKLGYNRDRSDGPNWDHLNRLNGHGWGDWNGGVLIDGTRFT